MIGKTLSHYKVLEKIGQGGMGEVYRAEDTNLSREVAIKVLPEQFTQDPQRLARFEREAKLLASLNHPNIAAIHSFEHSDEIHFLVLELVPGETLAERVAKGPVPVEEALEVCRQIAEGVEAAHEKGVIHRDLKPANVKVTPEGKVKILDFGLAKAFEVEPPVTDISQSPTLTEEMTRAGVILGTAAYMSPEQARGKPVDKRADVFAFGAVLYELLTGKRAFEGETVTDVLAKVLEGEPKWDALPGVLPSTIRFLISRCLKKDPGKRLQHIDGARILIEEALTGDTMASEIGLGGAIQPVLWKRAIPWGIAVVAVMVAGLALWSLTSPRTNPLAKFVIATSPSAPLSNSSTTNELAISPDGRHIVYVGVKESTPQLYMRSLDELEATPIPGTEGVHGQSSFSPDGESLAFFAGGHLKRGSLTGGPPIALCDVTRGFNAGSWGPGDQIVFNSGGSLHRVSAAGGEPESLANPDFDKGEGSYRDPQILPGGKSVLLTVNLGDRRFQIAALSLETGEKTIVVEGGSEAHYLPTGHLVYVGAPGTLMAVPFDLESVNVTGDPVLLLEGVRQNAVADYALSEQGMLIYVLGGTGGTRSLISVDRQGRTQPLTETKSEFVLPRFSPDGETVAVMIGGGRDVWTYETARGTLTPFALETPGQHRSPIWTRDGKRITFSVATPNGDFGIYWAPADGSGEAEQLTSGERIQIPTSWSRDDELVYTEGLPNNGDIWVLPLEGERKPQKFLATEFNERDPIFSPDGRWIAFISDRSGQDQVYLTQYPGPGGIVPISAEGGTEPMWAPSGTELFYRNGAEMMLVSIRTEPTFRAETPRLLFEGSYTYTRPHWAANYDISPDGQRFLMIQEELGTDQINVVLNWFEEVKRLVPTN